MLSYFTLREEKKKEGKKGEEKRKKKKGMYAYKQAVPSVRTFVDL